MFITDSFIYYYEGQMHDGLSYFYFMIVTFSSVGFGDITAQTTEGRLAVILSIILLMTMIPSLS